MKKFIYFLMALILCSSAYSYFTLSSEAVKKDISPFGTAIFNLTIKNTGSSNDVLRIVSSDVLWNVQTDPLVDYMNGIEVPGFQTKETKILLKPDRKIKEGTYFVQVDFITKEERKISHMFEVSVNSKIIDYPINVFAEILEPTKIDPRKTSSIILRLKNENPIYITNAKVKLSSKYINQETVVDIPADSEKIVQFSLSFSETIQQQKDILKVEVTKDNETIAKTQKEIEISTFIRPYLTETKKFDKFLMTIEEVTFKNVESIEKEQAAIVAVSEFADPFTETKPKAKIITLDGKKYYSWDISLKPNETYKVQIIKNYRMPALILSVFIVLLLFYCVTRSPIIVRKRAEKVKIKEGGISELNVVIEIKNRSNKAVKNVRILDRLPKLSGISEEFGAHTPEPKIRKYHKTGEFVLDWDNLFLEPGEERIFSYKIESKLPIVGSLELKPTVIEFGPKKRRVYSNSFNLFVE